MSHHLAGGLIFFAIVIVGLATGACIFADINENIGKHAAMVIAYISGAMIAATASALFSSVVRPSNGKSER